jgi:molybdopterin converting factor small subunit
MSITMIMPVFLQPITENRETIEVQGNTTSECVDAIIRMYPDLKKMLLDDKGRILNYVGIFINGIDAYPDELKKPVKDGDEVHILYTLAGG